MTDDTIYRQDAIDQLHQSYNLLDAERRLEDMPPAQPEPQWIPCSERLPEDDTEVFVYLFDPQSPYIAWVCDCCWFTEEFQVEKENYPKAWMPLPEPYKENEG